MKVSSATPSATPKRGILSLKKQHLQDGDEENDINLSSSCLAAIRMGFNRSKSSSSNSGSKSSGSSSSSSEEDVERCATTQRSPVAGETVIVGPSEAPDTAIIAPGSSATAPETADAGPSSAIQGSPLRNPDFDDVSNADFEPAATSTPIPQEEVEESEFDIIERNINEEIRDGKCMLKYIDFRFSREVQDFAQRNSEKYVSKLRNRRTRVSKTLAYLLRHRTRINNLIASLGDERDELDTAIHKFKFFIDRVPF